MKGEVCVSERYREGEVCYKLVIDGNGRIIKKLLEEKIWKGEKFNDIDEMLFEILCISDGDCEEGISVVFKEGEVNEVEKMYDWYKRYIEEEDGECIVSLDCFKVCFEKGLVKLKKVKLEKEGWLWMLREVEE